jgi:hypothetical protein
MGFKYRVVSTASTAETLFRIYDFVVNTSSQSIYRLVNDTGTAVALHNGTTFVTSFANAAAVAAGSYMVIEPTTALGSGNYRHQIRINNTGSTVNSVQVSTRGGWTNAGAAFGASSATAATQFNDGAAPGAGSQLYLGCGTFAINGSNTGTYFWTTIRDTGSANCDQMAYAGNYYPWAIASDVNPVCMLARVPELDGGSNNEFGRSALDANTLSRCVVEYAQTTSLVAAGYARVGINDDPRAPGAVTILRDLAGNYVPLPVYLFRNSTAMLGNFGDHLRGIDTSLSDYDVNHATTPTRIVMGHLSMHFDITL